MEFKNVEQVELNWCGIFGKEQDKVCFITTKSKVALTYNETYYDVILQ